MNLKKLRIVVDEREKKSGIPDLLKEIGINLEIKTLPIGDYIVAPETVVERKTISDLISSIFDGRLFDQCNRLKEHYQFPILLIEGDISEIEKLTENPFVFYGAISSIVIDFKIPVIPTPSASHTSKLLISMCSRKDIANGPFIKKIRKSNNLQKLVRSVNPASGFDSVKIPGDIENNSRKERKLNGIPIPDEQWESIKNLAERLAVELPV